MEFTCTPTFAFGFTCFCGGSYTDFVSAVSCSFVEGWAVGAHEKGWTVVAVVVAVVVGLGVVGVVGGSVEDMGCGGYRPFLGQSMPLN